MGIYLNPGDDLFLEAARSEIYVDKTELLACTNQVIKRSGKYLCVSRPRRFGKSMAANMVAAYYDRTAHGEETFRGLKIAQDAGFGEHCGKYDVIRLNMQEFLSRAGDMDGLLDLLRKSILWDLLEEYPNIRYFDDADLVRSMSDIYAKTRRPFVIVIDEWDCVFREYREHRDWQEKYLDFLRGWLKDQAYVGLVYMTGILPIKKYGTHSALNMFREFSMENPRELGQYVGFTSEEVNTLCQRYGRSFEECRTWYDGYAFDGVGEVYNPHSVVEAMLSGVFGNYWNQTETFEALKVYIDMDYDGLREAVIALMARERKRINTGKFANDMTTFHDMDDVLTLLVHLGYLGYDFATSSVFIPNQEILMEYVNAVEAGGWEAVAKAVRASEDLLEATLAMDEEGVAKGIEEAHFETSHLQYNDENALSYIVSLAYYTARRRYTVIRELPAGKGFADLVFLPRPQHAALPALVVELKWNRDAETAIRQIKEKRYPKALEGHAGEMLLVGISYDRETRKHECCMERCSK